MNFLFLLLFLKKKLFIKTKGDQLATVMTQVVKYRILILEKILNFRFNSSFKNLKKIKNKMTDFLNLFEIDKEQLNKNVSHFHILVIQKIFMKLKDKCSYLHKN